MNTFLNRTQLFISVFLLLFVLCTQAQQISVDPMPLSNHLPSTSVQRIFQDREGFIWLGTSDGLCRYDAYNVLVFRSGKKKTSSLTNNEITCITEDQGNRLLIGTRKGMNMLDKETYRITPMQNEEINNQEIRSILVDKEGYVWIGTLTWVYRFSSDFSTWKKFDYDLPITSVNSIYQDADEDVWVLLWNEGLHRYDTVNDTFIRQSKIGEKDNPFRMFRDNKGRYWVCTWGDGLYRFYPGNKENIYEPVQLTREKQKQEKVYFSISQDGINKYIWLMSSSGISAIAVDDKENIVEIDLAHAFDAYNNIYSELLGDRDGNIWIAAFDEGVLTVNMSKPIVTNYTIPYIKEHTGFSTNIRAIYEDEDGDLWVNQNRWGLGIFSPQTNRIRFYQDFPTLKNLPGMDMISYISGFTLDKKEIWLAPENEPVIYSTRKEKDIAVLNHCFYLEETTANPGNPRLFFEDNNHHIWIVTTQGLLVKPHKKESVQDTEFQMPGITGITGDKEGKLWISTKNTGIYRITLTEDLKIQSAGIEHYNVEKDKLISNNIEAISSDRTGNIWIGSKQGHIFVYRSKEKTFENLSGQFEMLEEGILNITIDNLGHVWISTNKRIIEYNPESQGLMIYFSGDESVISSFGLNSFYNDQSGKLFYGGNKGISIFTPYDKLSEEPQPVKTVVTEVKINGNSVFDYPDNRQLGVLSETIHFMPEDKNIEINFSSLNYVFPKKLQYGYKLQGIDKDWVYTDASRPFAIYNQLPKGKYTFLLKTTDANGLWSKEITQVSIYKTPALYETWWAYTLYIVLFMWVLYFIYRHTRNRICLREDLKIAQIEKEKGEELTQVKLRYFTNVSHDFLTPLTIINCLIDDVEITYKKKVPQFELMRTNIDRLKRLLRQILDFRKVESGNMKLRISQDDIARFIKEVCLNNFQPLMKKKQINFLFHTVAEHIPAYFDVDKVDKIIFNLLSNAFKYTPDYGEIRVELDQETTGNHVYIIIRVSDTGVGIAPENLDKIFVRFYTDRNGAPVDTNGIGLSLTLDLLTLHHGTIQVESEINKGTVFTVRIPIDRMSYQEIELATPDRILVFDRNIELMETNVTDWSEESDLPEVGKENIQLLLVEDNEELLYLMYHILSKRYHVTIAKNGVEALEFVRKNDIHIIISDVMMPEMDGLTLCRTLKSDIETSHIPLILLTAKNSTEDRIECYKAGADGYISKPFDLKVLEARISNFLLTKRSKQQEFRTDVSLNLSTLETSPIDKEFLDKIIGIIQTNMVETGFDVNTLADKLFVSKSSLYRKVKAMTGLSPVEFIRNIRLKHASRMLREGKYTVSEVAYASGFSNPKYFATCFKEEFNVTPTEFQRGN